MRHALAGGLILLGLVQQILAFAGIVLLPHGVGYVLWMATLLLWRDIPRRTRWQAGALAAIGLGLLILAGWRYASDIAWPAVTSGNTYVVAMLVGVSFIGLIGNRSGSSRPLGRPITGRRGTLGTWLGVHLLGTILNLSTVFMIGDRLARRAPLTTPQLLALNRGLSSAALWSPFFASMGVVMTLAPGMEYLRVLAIGLPLALVSGALTTFELSRRFDLAEVAGFSLSPRSLLMPVSMAILVMLFHFQLTPRLGIVSIITFLLPAVALVSNLPAGPRWTLRRVRQHTLTRLPAMRGEIALFLSAGLLTLGLSTFVAAATGSEWRLFSHFGSAQAVISFLAIVISAVAGLHPIIGVSVLASMLDLSGNEQTLFAFTALASWAVGTSVGPLSGINLSLQGRYGVSGYRMMRHNLGYALLLSGLVMVAIIALDAWV
ncbi:hypothetical protein HOP62_01405 [Halomonas sp. MCCC 1A17488]|uniref:Uncharacterized protein n=1 Tax=Billgrantia sulfidoxydans TaxID=2733484 RepID=A0ABX7WAS1_9GAMM|nr:hypothetical protein [Halomonas sp. MCCC 1A17488]MCE8014730.1 hypothetical protein [Halomonas sp. MCCC 1A17488]MCG3238063.1 hypothetical protein [Halomonas sp. MCCC 1A17488]QPP51630.1 hypothetical protein I4484_12995 [Halomonas sp. SS10-MC5]QTP57106.1 hypothetical protein HNO51_12680 [Halomonas sulfidoxydans]